MGTTITSLRRFAVRLAAALGLGLALVPAAQAQVFKCVDEQGRVEFTDQNRRGCKQLESLSPPVASPSPVRASAPIPSVRPNNAGGSGPAAAPASVTPASFPRVDTAQQRVRDDDRREILNDELRLEEKKLGDLRRDFNNGEPERQGNERNYAKYQERVAGMRDEIGRTERNIASLRREIANIR